MFVMDKDVRDNVVGGVLMEGEMWKRWIFDIKLVFGERKLLCKRRAQYRCLMF